MPIITKLDLAILVYDDDKECGEAVLELVVGDVIHRWGHGNNEDWEDPSIHRFEHPGLSIYITDKNVKCYGKLEERPYQVNIDAGLEWDASFTLDDGSKLNYGARYYYRTGDGLTGVELKKK